MRKVSFSVGEFYHIYNRGVDKRSIFQEEIDTKRFFMSMSEFNVTDPIGSIYERSFAKEKESGAEPKLVNFVAYCLNSNHYHFLLQQVAERGIEKFMHRLSTGYTRYFNDHNERSGSLFQGSFKAVLVGSNEYLLHLSAYINLNDRVHQLGGLASKLVKSRSSWDEYLTGSTGFCEKKIILEQFGNVSEYRTFAEDSLGDTLERRKEDKALQLMLLE